MTVRKHKIELDFDTADGITLLVLKEYRDVIKKEVKAHIKRSRICILKILHSTPLLSYRHSMS